MLMASSVPLAAAILVAVGAQYVFGILMTLTALFLIMLVLVQRGRGGGLAGAFGGMGGQSAFGTKAGDMFTKITIGASIFWLILCIGAVRFLGTTPGAFGRAAPPSATQLSPLSTGATDEPLLPDSGTGAPSSIPASDSPASDSPASDIPATAPTDAPAATGASTTDTLPDSAPSAPATGDDSAGQ